MDPPDCVSSWVSGESSSKISGGTLLLLGLLPPAPSGKAFCQSQKSPQQNAHGGDHNSLGKMG